MIAVFFLVVFVVSAVLVMGSAAILGEMAEWPKAPIRDDEAVEGRVLVDGSSSSSTAGSNPVSLRVGQPP